MKQLNKKGFQLTEVPQLVIVLLVVAIVLGVGATVLTQIRTTQLSTTTAFYTNSTFVASNTSAVDFTPSDIAYDSGGSKVYMVSASCTGVLLTNTSDVDITAEFTVASCTALLIDEDGTYNATNVKANFTYTHNVYDYDYNISSVGLEGQKDFSDWQSTFIVILAAAVILGLIYRYLFMG